MPHVQVRPDDLEARLALEPGERLNEYQALIWIARRGVRHGLMHEAIARFAELEGPAEVLVAIAVQPSAGRDAQVDAPLGNTAFPLDPVVDEHGRVAFPEWPLPAMARAGDVVAVKVPPVPGRPGRTVVGAPIGPTPPPVADVPLRAGLGTELAFDGLRVVAAIDGNPCCVDGLVTVRPELKIPGDLTAEDPGVRFGGNVLVAGSVAGDVEILAAGDVTVLGDVAGAKIAAGGRVVVHGHVDAHATIIASADVAARSIADATVRLAGTLAVREDLVRTQVEGARRTIVGARLAASPAGSAA